MNCEAVRAQLDAYALGALDAEERSRIEAHLLGCPDCRQQAAALLEIAHQLPKALSAASPYRLPPALRSRVIESLGAPAESAPPAAGDVASAPPEGPTGEREPAGTIARWRGWLSWQPRTIGAVAAMLVLAVTLAWSFHLSQALGRERALRAEFEGLVDQQEIVLEVVDSNETVKAVLRPPSGSNSNAYGKLYTRPDMPHVVVMAARLPQPAEGEAYHLWLTDDGQSGLAGVLNLNEEGFGMLVFDAPVDGPTYEEAELTLQPEGSSAQSGPTILTWQATP